MADSRLHAGGPTENTSPAATDIIPVQSGSANMQRATLANVLKLVWPVGSVFLSVVSTSPATLLGFGTWAAMAVGKFLVGVDAGDPDFDAAEDTGGAKTHTLTEAEIPSHVHGELAPTSASGGAMRFGVDTNASGSVAAGLNTAAAGGGGAHNNLPPFCAVFAWKRTA